MAGPSSEENNTVYNTTTKGLIINDSFLNLATVVFSYIATPTEEKLVMKVVLPVLSVVILALLGTPAICIVIIKLCRKKGLKVHVVAIVMT